MVDAEYAGRGRGWADVGAVLHGHGLLDKGDLDDLAWAETFGAWIGNSDMHLGNISLAPAAGYFQLLPIYDMLPTAFAPVRGELPEVKLRPPIRTDNNGEVWEPTRRAAATFWDRVADDTQCSPSFRARAHDEARSQSPP